MLNLGNKNVELWPWPHSCAFDDDLKQVSTCWNADPYWNLFCFMPQLVFNLRFDTCSVRLLVCLFRDFVFDSSFRVIYEKKTLWIKPKLLVKTSKDPWVFSFWWRFIYNGFVSSPIPCTWHLYMSQSEMDLRPLPHLRWRYLWELVK